MNEANEPRGIKCAAICAAGCLACIADSAIVIVDVVTGGSACAVRHSIYQIWQILISEVPSFYIYYMYIPKNVFHQNKFSPVRIEQGNISMRRVISNGENLAA